MIDKYDVALTMLTQSEVACSALECTFIAEDESYTPNATDTYIKESMFFGTETNNGYDPMAGTTLKGIYQLTICTPKSSASVRWDGLKLVDGMSDHYAFGNGIDGLIHTVEILNITTSKPDLSVTHVTHVLSIEYIVIN